MEQSDIVLMLDKKYAAEKIPCPNEGKEVKRQFGSTTEHASLAVHKSGSLLICGVCGYTQPIARV